MDRVVKPEIMKVTLSVKFLMKFLLNPCCDNLTECRKSILVSHLKKEIPEASVGEKGHFLSEVGSCTAATVKMIQVKSPLRINLFNKFC